MVSTRCAACSLNSFVNVRYSSGMPVVPFCEEVYSMFLDSAIPGPAQRACAAKEKDGLRESAGES